jgi:hypothetical protein
MSQHNIPGGSTSSSPAPITHQIIDAGADPPAVPSTPHTAYVAGWAAARRGEDLATVIYDASLRWPMGDIREWCELVCCASLGFWTGEGGAP